MPKNTWPWNIPDSKLEPLGYNKFYDLMVFVSQKEWQNKGADVSQKWVIDMITKYPKYGTRLYMAFEQQIKHFAALEKQKENNKGAKAARRILNRISKMKALLKEQVVSLDKFKKLRK